jgi:hypothetical protein
LPGYSGKPLPIRGTVFHLPFYAAVSRQKNNADAPCSSSRELSAACESLKIKKKETGQQKYT